MVEEKEEKECVLERRDVMKGHKRKIRRATRGRQKREEK